MITNEQLHACKTMLTERQMILIPQVENYVESMLSSKEASGELSSYDNHPADMGTEQYDREKDITLNEHAEKELEDINEALHAINDGTYGICSVCGNTIEFERLEAVPTTDRCIEHASDGGFDQHASQEVPFSPNINPNDENPTAVGYDGEDAWQEVSQYGTSNSPSDFYDDKEDYDEMYENSDEMIGGVGHLENVLEADIAGNYTGFRTYNKK